MSADLHLYVLPNTPESREAIRLVDEVEVIGLERGEEPWVRGHVSFDEWERRCAAAYGEGWSNPNIWIGQVSWVKSGLLGEPDRYVPAPVLRIQQLTEGGLVLTAGPAGGTAGAIMAALNLPNRSIYGRSQYVYDRERFAIGSGCTVRRFGPHRIQRMGTPKYGRYVRDGNGIAKRRNVKRFLAEHLGELVFPASL